MDEKGFLLGITGRLKRIFNRTLYESRQVRQAIQDGSREWISLIACICADGSTVDPALIYRSSAETLQSSWVEEINVKSHTAFCQTRIYIWATSSRDLLSPARLFISVVYIIALCSFLNTTTFCFPFLSALHHIWHNPSLTTPKPSNILSNCA